MSGGHWDYVGSTIKYGVETISHDTDVRARWPMVTEILSHLSVWLWDIEHEMDWDLSGDAAVHPNFENIHAGTLLVGLMKSCPDEWFPRGKWATIQAFEERMNINVD